MRSQALFSGVLAAAVLVAGCTSSTGEYHNLRGSSQTANQGTVKRGGVATNLSSVDLTVSGLGASEELLAAYVASDPDREIEGAVVADGGDVELAAPTGTVYGKDVICLVADKAWFTANTLDVPDSTREAAPWLRIGDPAESLQTALWLVGRAGGSQEKLKKNLAKYAKWGAELPWFSDEDASGEEPRVLIRSALYPWQEVNNLGTGSRWVTLQRTCVQTDLLASAQSEDGEQFVDFLVSTKGQVALAELGVAYPVADVELPESIQLIAPYPQEAKDIPTEDVSAWLESLESALGTAQSD